MYAPANNAAKTYQNAYAEHAVDSDDGYTLVAKLMARLMARIGMAKHCIANGDIAAKGDHVTRAIDIVNVLQVAVDQRHNPQLAENLIALYDYAARRLLHANLHSDTAALDEVHGLLSEVKQAWDAIAPESE